MSMTLWSTFYLCMQNTSFYLQIDSSDSTEMNFNHLAELVVDYYSNGHFFLQVKIKLLL